MLRAVLPSAGQAPAVFQALACCRLRGHALPSRRTLPYPKGQGAGRRHAGAMAAAGPPQAPPADGRSQLSVAVIGAGAAGLVAARELRREGHAVAVFEAGACLGGVWNYTDDVEDDPLGANPGRRVHGSMYAGLRTNLPREVMGFTDVPFDASFPGSHDPRQFPSHQEVMRYIDAFAEQYNLRPLIQFHTSVEAAVPLPAAAAPQATGAGEGSSAAAPGADPQQEAWRRWELSLRRRSGAAASTSGSGSGDDGAVDVEQYDAIVVCNGHYSEPRLPALPGQDAFPGVQLHSHNYRRPEAFAGQTVVLVGASSSGVDIAEELAVAGATVYLCARAWENPLTGEPLLAPDASGVPGATAGVSHKNVIRSPNVAALGADGSVVLEGGAVLAGVDAVMYCTGYRYAFPFLDGTGAVTTDDNRVAPLYQHLFPPALAPTLSFIGLPWKVLPFPQFELQAKWIARVLSRRSALPPAEEMSGHAQRFYAELEASGTPVRFTHRQAGDVQWDYNSFLIESCGSDVPAWPEWRAAMYNATGTARRDKGAAYRDLPLVGTEAAEEQARLEAARLRSSAPARV